MNPTQLFSARMLPAILIGAALLVSFISLVSNNGSKADKPVGLNDAGQAQVEVAARRLEEPGLYVAEEIPYTRLDGPQFKRLKEAIRGARLPTRVAVLPYGVTRDGRIDTGQLTEELRRQVDQPGVYAVVVDNRGSGQLDAAYWPSESAAQDSDATDDANEAIAEAVAEANSCCQRDYPRAIDGFLDRAMDRPIPYLWLLWWLLPILAVGALLTWLRWFRVRSWEPDDEQSLDDQVVTSMTSVLREEVSELSFRVAALPTEDLDTGTGAMKTSNHVTTARRLLAAAEGKSTKLASPRHRSLSDLVGVVRMIADLRYELHVIDALRLGGVKPPRTPPCFIDPRHGPSSTSREYAPTGKDERMVQVCEACAGELDSGQRPAVRRLPKGHVGGSTGWANYWQADAGIAYVEGYWRGTRFPDEEFEESRIIPISPRRQDPIDMLKLRLRTDRE
jgi:hypothetical protein